MDQQELPSTSDKIAGNCVSKRALLEQVLMGEYVDIHIHKRNNNTVSSVLLVSHGQRLGQHVLVQQIYPLLLCTCSSYLLHNVKNHTNM